MTETQDCFICRKHRGLEAIPGGPIYEDDLVFSGHSWSSEDQTSPYLGGFIVEPKRHVRGWAELNDLEAETVGRVIRDVAKALMGEVGVEHVYVFVLGHHVPHLHIWVVPRYAETPREYWGFSIFDWPGRPSGGTEQVEELCERIRARM